jgi:hypothetical protein
MKLQQRFRQIALDLDILDPGPVRASQHASCEIGAAFLQM